MRLWLVRSRCKMGLPCRPILRCIQRKTLPEHAFPLFYYLAQPLHSSASKPANPVNHPLAPGPPPQPPESAPSSDEERVSRKKKQAELVERGKNIRVNPAKPGTALQKRFWKDVKVEETSYGYQIYLDSRPLRTPSKTVLTIPLAKPHLATAIALEWDLLVSARQAQKQHYLPLTSLTARALDVAGADLAGDGRIRESIVKMLLSYLSTDTLLCWAPEAKDPHQSSRGSLREQQRAVAEPIMSFLTEQIWPGAELQPALGEDSILPKPQPEATAQIIREWTRGLSAWELAALERGVLASKSLCVAVRLLVEWSGRWVNSAFTENKDVLSTKPLVQTEKEAKFTVEAAAEACSLEVRWQTGMWGEVEDTHDVEKEDLRRQLGSVVLLVSGCEA